MSSESSGSATGNPRNKVALRPGHSLMDWIRLGNSGVDLTGTKGAFLDVTPSQLAQHNKSSDAWLCIRGKVYNVTRYLDFHPGGVDELMKGVGKDATVLFNKIHPWVNYESLLKKCLVGKLVRTLDEDILSSGGAGGSSKLESNSIAGALNSIARLGNSIVPPVAVSSQDNSYTSTDWYQQNDYITLVLYYKQPCSTQVVVDGRREGEMWVKVGSHTWAGWRVDHGGVRWPPRVTVSDTKTEVRLSKATAALWPSLQPILSSPLIEPVTVKVASVTPALHNVALINLIISDKVYYHIPIGYHILFSATIKGVSVERNYTPVEGLVGSLEPGIWLLVKSYEDGVMSSWLTSRKPNDSLGLSYPLGSFRVPTYLAADSTLLLFAAGSGITPMIKLINWALREKPLMMVKLVFFNKTEKDIIWKKELSQLAARNRCFSCNHVLSEGETEWKGQRGWVTLQLVQSFLPDYLADRPNLFYICVCGPISFTQLTERYVQDLGYGSDHYFCFRG